MIDPNAPISSIVLHHESKIGDVVLDIVPSRWTSRVPLDGAIRTVIADCARAKRVDHMADQWSHRGAQHPDIDIMPGGIVLHQGCSLPRPVHVHVREHTLLFPNEAPYPRAAFSPEPYIHQNATFSRRALHAVLRDEPDDHRRGAINRPSAPFQRSALGIVAGMLDNLAGSSYEVWPPHVARWACRRVAILASPMLASMPLSGTSAAHKGRDVFSDLARHLLDAWLLRPDRGWMPTGWVRTPKLDTITAALDAADVAAGWAAMDALRGYVNAHPKGTAVLDMAASKMTAHDAMEQKTLEVGVLDALLRAYTPHPHHLKQRTAAKVARMGA